MLTNATAAVIIHTVRVILDNKTVEQNNLTSALDSVNIEKFKADGNK